MSVSVVPTVLDPINVKSDHKGQPVMQASHLKDLLLLLLIIFTCIMHTCSAEAIRTDSREQPVVQHKFFQLVGSEIRPLKT